MELFKTLITQKQNYMSLKKLGCSLHDLLIHFLYCHQPQSEWITSTVMYVYIYCRWPVSSLSLWLCSWSTGSQTTRSLRVRIQWLSWRPSWWDLFFFVRLCLTSFAFEIKFDAVFCFWFFFLTFFFFLLVYLLCFRSSRMGWLTQWTALSETSAAAASKSLSNGRSNRRPRSSRRRALPTWSLCSSASTAWPCIPTASRDSAQLWLSTASTDFSGTVHSSLSVNFYFDSFGDLFKRSNL